MKILVTGGHGYLGGYICQSLIEAGHEVVSIDVKSDQSSVSKSILADFSDKKTLEFSLKKADALIHLAAISGVSKASSDPITCVNVNIDKLLILLEMVRQKRPTLKFFFMSTYDLVDKNNGKRLAEDALDSIYQYSKYCGELMCDLFSQNHDLNIKIIRPSTLFGINNFKGPRVLNTFIKAALADNPIQVHDPQKLLTFTSVIDIGASIQTNLNSKLTNKEFRKPVNIVSPEKYTLIELAYLIKTSLSSKSEILSAKNMSFHVAKGLTELETQKARKGQGSLLIDWLNSIRSL